MSPSTSLPEVNESIREVDADTWLVANRFLLSRQSSAPSGQAAWSDGKGSFFVLAALTGPAPTSFILSHNSELQKVYDAGNCSAVWRVGEAFLKVKKITIAEATREHTTLDYLHHRKAPLGFEIPRVHYHDEFDGRYYIVLSRLPGPTVGEAWPQMNEGEKQACVKKVADICERLSAWKGQTISGVDGKQLSDLFFTRYGADERCESQHMVRNCLHLGMDCSSFVFYHCDLGPGNIIISPTDGSIGILDWETAGFVPKEWIRTKFCFSSGMDLPVEDADARVDWRRRVSRQLGAMGYREMVGEWSEVLVGIMSSH